MPNPQFTVNLSDYGFDRFISELRSKQLIVGNKIPMNVVANTAAIGRRASEKSVIATSFRMGEVQQRGRKGVKQVGRFSEWSSKTGGYVSINDVNKFGEHRRMGNFSFESTARRTKRGEVRVSEMAHARYSHLLANLFERPAMYSKDSPLVGLAGGKKKRYLSGTTRAGRPVLSSITASMRSAVPSAIRRSERKFSRELER